ncbi:MAG: hypothetical protein RLO81_17090, partial [Fulvivirga sp.]
HNAKGNLSQFLLEESKYDSAILLAKEDLKYSIKQRNYSSQYGLLGIIAISYYEQQNLDSTQVYLNRALSIVNKVYDRGHLQFVTDFIYDYFLKTNQPVKLNQFAKRLDYIHDSLTNVRVKSDFDLNRSQFELENAQKQIDQLKKINQLQNDKALATKRFNIILVMGIILSMTLLIIIFRYLRINKRKNELLKNKNAQITTQNEKLISQKDSIQRQSERILELNHLLEQKMDETTKELVIKNKKLSDYAYHNSHNIRGPLARILGLISLWESDYLNQDEKEEMLEEVKHSALELDEIVKELNRKLE